MLNSVSGTPRATDYFQLVGPPRQAALTKQGGFRGAFSLLAGMKESALYASAVEAATKAMSEMPSIVNHSIVSAVEGDFGDVHRTRRTRGSRLWINPLMAMYFTFELEALASHVQYLSLLGPTQTMFEVTAVIDAHQRACDELRPWVGIPI